jgi:hypothetical protein
MRVLFFVHTLGRTRHFTSVIQELIERHHTVLLAVAQGRQAEKSKKGFYERSGIEIISCPARREDRWGTVIDPLRRARDRMRFLDPRYANAASLAARAAEHAPPGWNRAVEERPWVRRNWKLTLRALALAETITPCDPEFLRFVESCAPDVVLVTPLVDFGSYQTEYVKCAHRLGVPVVYVPFSWDNLTNRGLIRVTPDRALVWNARQQREAIEFHDMAEEQVVVTGAPRFDEFFAMTPTLSRERFCAELKVDPARPLLLYLCSANFIAPREVAFVREWIGHLRGAATGSWLRDCNVLVRPHPANQDEWESADLSDLPSVAVWSRRSTLNADRGLFDSLFHAIAAVGLNTSAMIEAAIVGRPGFTIARPEFAGGQEQTLHFKYLLADHGGIVTMSRSFGEHVQQLEALPDESQMRERTRRFLGSFVRPRGLEIAAGRVMAEEVERAASLRKRPQRTPLWHHPLRWSMDAALRLGFEPRLKTSRRPASS